MLLLVAAYRPTDAYRDHEGAIREARKPRKAKRCVNTAAKRGLRRARARGASGLVVGVSCSAMATPMSLGRLRRARHEKSPTMRCNSCVTRLHNYACLERSERARALLSDSRAARSTINKLVASRARTHTRARILCALLQASRRILRHISPLLIAPIRSIARDDFAIGPIVSEARR